jgi:hypothetical protein
MRICIFVVYLVAILMLSLGCSSGGGHNPVTPEPQSEGLAQPVVIPSEMSAFPYSVSNSDQLSGTGVFGVYNLQLDYDSLTADLIPVRNGSALGDMYQADITGFLSSLCSDCLQIVGVSLAQDTQYLEVTFRLHHPIPAPIDPSNPTPSDRLDLHLFDVRGIVISEGNTVFPMIQSDINGDGTADEIIRCNAGFVDNADGYTSFFDTYFDNNIFVTSANIHPFKMFFEDAKQGNYLPDVAPENGWVSLSSPQGQNVFPQGNRTDDVKYVFALGPGENLNLLMAFDASYGTTAKFSIPYPDLGCRMNPRYFLPEFHRKEAWKAFVDISNNLLSHGAPSLTANLSLTIFDWQAGLLGSGPIDFFTSNLNAISTTSDVETVALYIPALFTNPIIEPGSKIGTGTLLDPYVYSYVIPNELDPIGGTYYGIAAIRDTLIASGGGPDGATRDLNVIDLSDFTNYQVFPITVAAHPPNIPPVALFTTNPANPQIQSGDSVTFDGSTSYDADGDIIRYDWDFEFSGTFQSDATGANPPAHIYTSPDPSQPHLFYAVLKVLDNGDPQLEGMFGREVIVEANEPPVAVIQIEPDQSEYSECDLLTLDGSASHDNSAIIAYEWDFNYSQSDPGFTIEATGPVVERRFTPGIHDIMLRVWDDSSPALNGVTRKRLIVNELSAAPGKIVLCANFLLNVTDSINSHSFSGGGQKSLVLSPSGIVTAFWVDEGNVAGGPAIKYSQSSNAGRSFSAPSTANSAFISGGHAGLRPTAAVDNLGNIHLAYASDSKFYYQHGGEQGGFSSPIEVASGDRTYGAPAIAVDVLGNIHYFYTEAESGGNVPLKLAISSDGGNSFNSPVLMSTDGRFPSAATANHDSVVLAYEGKTPSASDASEIWVRYQRSGSLYYPEIRVSDGNLNDGISTRPSVDVGENGSVHVAWMDSREGDVDTDFDIFYSYSATELSFSRNVRVNDNPESPGNQVIQDYPSIGADMSGRVFIVWRDYRSAPGLGGDVFLANTTELGGDFKRNMLINYDSSGDDLVAQGPPSILVTTGAAMLIMWGDERNATTGLGDPFTGESDIYYTFGQLF